MIKNITRQKISNWEIVFGTWVRYLKEYDFNDLGDLKE